MKLIAVTSFMFLVIVYINCEKRFQNLEVCKTSGKTTKIIKCEIIDGRLHILVDNLYQHKVINVRKNYFLTLENFQGEIEIFRFFFSILENFLENSY